MSRIYDEALRHLKRAYAATELGIEDLGDNARMMKENPTDYLTDKEKCLEHARKVNLIKAALKIAADMVVGPISECSIYTRNLKLSEQDLTDDEVISVRDAIYRIVFNLEYFKVMVDMCIKDANKLVENSVEVCKASLAKKDNDNDKRIGTIRSDLIEAIDHQILSFDIIKNTLRTKTVGKSSLRYSDEDEGQTDDENSQGSLHGKTDKFFGDSKSPDYESKRNSKHDSNWGGVGPQLSNSNKTRARLLSIQKSPGVSLHPTHAKFVANYKKRKTSRSSKKKLMTSRKLKNRKNRSQRKKREQPNK
jgi:hypothetical protein